ncbi:hypothetical protein L1987_79847 [Smallanthus sonchifolius]|uniref:Uncharacterized protein n=1 Tax=Smallanthus sonchifolius TaxID=185202 RepID=A0ACB8YKA3_9ASTR|nr:hypothetical protein L1987_79847 [Smallanthus sonchifolius]
MIIGEAEEIRQIVQNTFFIMVSTYCHAQRNRLHSPTNRRTVAERVLSTDALTPAITSPDTLPENTG